MLYYNTREAPQHHLDPAHNIDAAARAVHVTYPNRDALHRSRMSRKQFAEPSSDVRTIVVVQSNTINPDVRRSPGGRFAIDSTRFGRRHLLPILPVRDDQRRPCRRISSADASTIMLRSSDSDSGLKLRLCPAHTGFPLPVEYALDSTVIAV
jgi:hypothetical protein